MIEIYACMGSACYVKGSPIIVEKLQHLIALNRLAARVQLKGAFCLGPCIQGVVLKIGNRQFKNVRPENIDDRFITEIMPYIELIRGEEDGK